MTTNPSVTDSINGNDFIVIRKNKDFDYRVIPYPDFIQQLKADLGETGLVNEYVSMSANTTLDLNSVVLNIWAKIVVANIDLTLTVNLPLPTYALNGQEFLLSNPTANTVTLAFNGFGAQIIGSVSSIASGTSIVLKYDKSLNGWYKV
ncbi:MAG: hypothetical protein GAK29_01448 [Acinetobacter bereziniae]|uniref:Uncharacterized protein n=1 Tax=Acinetobacter bereziniae TaxID=106648 RepID=A0A833US49_ACIBZ|nr:MAG: hypothetical protein GAK29_01448 [Acinetobacter bereziniae]